MKRDMQTLTTDIIIVQSEMQHIEYMIPRALSGIEANALAQTLRDLRQMVVRWLATAEREMSHAD